MDRALSGLSLGNFLGGIPTNSLNVATLVGQKSESAAVMVKQAGIESREVQVESVDAVPIAATLTQVPFASQGDVVKLYVSGGTVVGAVRAAHAQVLTEDMAAMRAEIDTLKASMRSSHQ